MNKEQIHFYAMKKQRGKKEEENRRVISKKQVKIQEQTIIFMRSRKKPKSPLGVYLIIVTLQAQQSAFRSRR